MNKLKITFISKFKKEYILEKIYPFCKITFEKEVIVYSIFNFFNTL